MCTFLDLKHKSTIWDGTPPTCISNLVYMCVGRLRGHISQNLNLNRISIHSCFIDFFIIWASSAPGDGAGRWGISVMIKVSLYELRSVQR